MRARDNPFSTDRVLRVRYRPQGESWEEILRRLEGLNYRVAIVGPHGSGKTTLLEDLEARLRERGYRVRPVFLNEDTPLPGDKMREVLAGIGDGDILLMDGADHLPWLTWRWFRRRAAAARGLVITSHREGMLPALVRTGTSERLLREIVGELLGKNAAEFEGRMPGLIARHGGNLREAIRELYDVLAAL
jgi:GTPase SAR1 family protein